MCTKTEKSKRILNIYTKLLDGEGVNKKKMADKYSVNQRSIQRDIDDIRSFLYDQIIDSDGCDFCDDVVYNKKEKKYFMQRNKNDKFTNSEALAICKIILSSRAFTKNEIDVILKKFLTYCIAKSNKKNIEHLINNETIYYIEPKHKKQYLELMWNIGDAIKQKKYIEIKYEKSNNEIVKRTLKPMTIMFHEFYFYLTAFIEDEKIQENFKVKNDVFPTIYRIDKIKYMRLLNKNFNIHFDKKFDEKYFRDRIQFMHGGKLRRLEFKYVGPDINFILDKLPTAKIVEKSKNFYTIKAEVFGTGIDMWLKSQGEYIKDIKII